MYPSHFSHSSNESQPQKQQVSHQLLLKKTEYNISRVWLFLEKKKHIPFKKSMVFLQFSRSSLIISWNWGNRKCVLYLSSSGCFFFLSQFHKNWVKSKQWSLKQVLLTVTSYFCCVRLLAHFLIFESYQNQRLSHVREQYCNGLQSVLETTWSLLHTFFIVREVDLIVFKWSKTCWFSSDVRFFTSRMLVMLVMFIWLANFTAIAVAEPYYAS